MSRNSKAQTSVEFLSILAITLVIMAIIVIMASGQITTIQNIKDQSDVKNSIYDLSSAAKEVYSQGEGSRKLVYISLPSSYEPDFSYVANNTIVIRAAGTDQATVETFDMHGTLPTTAGKHWVWVLSEGSRVRIGVAMVELDNNRIYEVMDCNSTGAADFTITNIWDREINITTAVTWTAPNLSMEGVPEEIVLGIGDSQEIDLEFEADEGTGGVYIGSIELTITDKDGNTDNLDVPITVEVVPCGWLYFTIDNHGPIITSIYQEPFPGTKFNPVAIFINASDQATGNNTITGCEVSVEGPENWTDMLPFDGAYNQQTELSYYNYTDGFNLGPHSVVARCTDFLNNTGPYAYYFFQITEPDELGPIVTNMSHTENPTVLTNITVRGTATETYTGSANIESCVIRIGSGGIWTELEPEDGAWDSTVESFSYNLGPMPVGYHSIYYRCTDSLGNLGGIYNDSFGVVNVDVILVLDRSGSMAWTVINTTNSNTVSTTNSNWYLVKNMSVTEREENDDGELVVSVRAGSSGCTVYYKVTINGVEYATGSRTSTSYGTYTTSINLSGITTPYNVELWLKRSGSCTVYNNYLGLSQEPIKIGAVKTSANSFLDVAGSELQAGLVSYSTSATTDKTLAVMTPTNQAALRSSINALVATGSTCIECGLEYAAAELTSVRARPEANKVIVLLTDGVGNVGDSVDGAVTCRENNITVYTIGFGTDVDDTELLNIALLTYGEYYFAPDTETLERIFRSIGRD